MFHKYLFGPPAQGVIQHRQDVQQKQGGAVDAEANHLAQLMTKQDDLEAHQSGMLKINEITFSDQKINIHNGVAIVSVQTQGAKISAQGALYSKPELIPLLINFFLISTIFNHHCFIKTDC